MHTSFDLEKFGRASNDDREFTEQITPADADTVDLPVVEREPIPNFGGKGYVGEDTDVSYEVDPVLDEVEAHERAVRAALEESFVPMSVHIDEIFAEAAAQGRMLKHEGHRHAQPLADRDYQLPADMNDDDEVGYEQ